MVFVGFASRFSPFSFFSFPPSLIPPSLQLSAISKEALPDSTELDIRRLIGYFVYYRFLNLAIVAPDSKQAQLVKKELTPLARKSCVVISKVLQNLFNLRVFKEDSKPETLSMMRLNPFLEEYFPKVLIILLFYFNY